MNVLLKMGEQHISMSVEDMAKYLLKPEEERNPENSFFIASNFAEVCYQALDKNFSEVDNPLIYQGLKPAREILQAKWRVYSEQRLKLENEVKELEAKIYVIEQQEHDNYMKAHDLSCQLDKLGLFHGAEKKNLKEQIQALRKPLEVPTEYTDKIKLHKSMIEEYKEIEKGYDNVVRRCNWVEQELLLKGKNCKTAEKPQKAQKSQKEEKATTTKPTTRPSFKDQIKPLKRL